MHEIHVNKFPSMVLLVPYINGFLELDQHLEKPLLDRFIAEVVYNDFCNLQ